MLDVSNAMKTPANAMTSHILCCNTLGIINRNPSIFILLPQSGDECKTIPYPTIVRKFPNARSMDKRFHVV